MEAHQISDSSCLENSRPQGLGRATRSASAIRLRGSVNGSTQICGI